LDLKELDVRIRATITDFPQLQDAITEYHQRILRLFDDHCKLYNLNYEEELQIVISPDHKVYPFYFPISLAFYEAVKIKQVLNYSLSKASDKTQFVNMVEFVVVDHVKSSSFFDNEERHRRLWEWIDEKRKTYPLITSPETPQRSSLPEPENIIRDLNLEWTKSSAILKDLSERLFESQFTSRKEDFLKVFTEKKRISWKREPEFLAYLLYKLNKEGFIKANKGKGYLKAAGLFYEYSGKLVTQKYLQDTSHNIAKRYPSKYSKLKRRVDSIISQIQS
jgi:hypothetical protein